MSGSIRENQDLIRLITKLVVEALEKEAAPQSKGVPVGVSNHHVHLSRADMDVLFGPGSELTPVKALVQPGQYAAQETVTVKGPKGLLHRVRVLGPLRSETQVEISVSDGFVLGVNPPVRESGQIQDSPGVELIGPKGFVVKKQGVIAALRHIHMTSADAKRFGVKDQEIVNVRFGGARGAVLSNVLIRAGDQYALEMHIDFDEANALGVVTGDCGEIVKW